MDAGIPHAPLSSSPPPRAMAASTSPAPSSSSPPPRTPPLPSSSGSPPRAMGVGIPSAPPSPGSPSPGSPAPGRRLLMGLSQAPVATRKRRGQWWAPIEVGVDFVPDSHDGGGGEFIFVPDDALDLSVFIRDQKLREKAAEEEAIKKAARRAEIMKCFRRQYPLLPSLTDQLRAANVKIRTAKQIEEHALERQKHEVDIGGHSQGDDDDMLHDGLLLDKLSQPMVSSSLFTWSGMQLGPPCAAAVVSLDGPPSLSTSPSCDAGMFRSGSGPPGGLFVHGAKHGGGGPGGDGEEDMKRRGAR